MNILLKRSLCYRSVFSCLIFVLSLWVPFQASAHQQKEAYITLLYNQNSGNLEISHRFLIHDAEHIFARLFDMKALDLSGDLIADQRTQSAFAAYIETKFELADENRQLIPLESVGFEVDGKYFWVYQETVMPEADELNLRHTALQTLWPKQTNHVNVERQGEVHSVRLTHADAKKWRTLKVPSSSKKTKLD